MEVNSNLNNTLCSTRNRERPRNYLFVCYVSSVSFKHILVVVGRRLRGIASEASREVLEKGRLRVYKVEQNRTTQGREWKERMLQHLVLTSQRTSHHRAGQVGAGLLGLAAAAILFELWTRP